MLKRLLYILFQGNIFIAICAAAYCIETAYIFDLQIEDLSFYLWIFFATLLAYNLHSLAAIRNSDAADQPKLVDPFARIIHPFFTGLAAIGTGYYTTRIDMGEHWMVVLLTALLTIGYSYPLLFWRSKRKLREYGIAKVIILALVWTISTVFLPLQDPHWYAHPIVWLVMARRFLFMIALCLPFDIRDVEKDQLQGIATVPNVIGVQRTYRLINQILLAIFVLTMPAFFLGAWGITTAILFSVVFTGIIIYLSRQNKHALMYLGAIDGMILLQALLVTFFVHLQKYGF
jgi:1,4-dihydroxy-2-naphthoate octaprenyltransferase